MNISKPPPVSPPKPANQPKPIDKITRSIREFLPAALGSACALFATHPLDRLEKGMHVGTNVTNESIRHWYRGFPAATALLCLSRGVTFGLVNPMQYHLSHNTNLGKYQALMASCIITGIIKPPFLYYIDLCKVHAELEKNPSAARSNIRSVTNQSHCKALGYYQARSITGNCTWFMSQELLNDTQPFQNFFHQFLSEPNTKNASYFVHGALSGTLSTTLSFVFNWQKTLAQTGRDPTKINFNQSPSLLRVALGKSIIHSAMFGLVYNHAKNAMNSD